MPTAIPTTPIAVDFSGTNPSADRATIAVIIPTFNHAHFLATALTSVLQQTRAADEIIVVDDGSTDNPAEVVGRFPNARLIRQENRGLAAARNTGLRNSGTSHVVFLDADDMLLPNALEAGLACFNRHPNCAFVYGGHRCIDANGGHLYDLFRAIDGDAHLAMLRRNEICMIATVLFHRDRLLAAGGFDESLRRCEDVDIYLRMTHKYPIAGYPTIVAEYRKHNENMSNNSVAQLKTVLEVLDRHEARITTTPDIRAALHDGRAQVRELYAYRMLAAAGARWRTHRDIRELMNNLIQSAQSSPIFTFRLLARALGRRIARALPRPAVELIQWIRGRPYQIPVGSVRFGDFKRPSPIGHGFGFDRGRPIDRYYIENFLAQNATDIRGRVLEIGDNSYTLGFGGDRVTQSDILHVDRTNARATFVGDLAQSETLPREAFDCVVLTQTLHLIFDMNAAVRTLYDALKPGGVLLLTVPGITRIDSGEWGGTWYWSLTAAAAHRLLETSFGTDSVAVNTYGNVFAATSFLYSLAVEDVDIVDLDVRDSSYPVIVTARAVKRTSA